MSYSLAKKSAAEHAVSYIKSGMIVGLGTGSTANYAITKIGERIRSGLRIQGGVPTSLASERLAIENGIPILKSFTKIDLTIDGADEVDTDGNLIKGGGGALTREKLVASASAMEIIVVDESKLVKTLGAFPLPVEVLAFGWEFVQERLKSFGCEVSLRQADSRPTLTDNENYILDCQFGSIETPGPLALELNAIPGVIENGLFVGLTKLLIVGNKAGRVEEKRF